MFHLDLYFKSYMFNGKGKICKKTFLNEGFYMHEDTFARRVIITQRSILHEGSILPEF